MKKAAAGLICFVLLFSMAACGRGSDENKEGTDSAGDTNPTEESAVIGASILSLEHPFYITNKEGMEATAKEIGAEVICLDAKFDVATQLSQIDDLISQEVDAIILTPVEAKAAVEMVEMCKSAGIPVIIQTTPVEAETTTQVVTDNIKLGGLLGENTARFINEELNGEAKIALLNYPTFTDCKEQEEGFVKAIEAACPNAEFVASIPSASKEDGVNSMDDILQAHPEVNIVFAVNDPVGLGAVQAIEAAGRDDIFTAFLCGGDEEAFQRLAKDPREGKIIGTVQLYPYEVGKASIKAALDAVEGKELPDAIYTEGRWWNADNVEKNLAAYPAYPED